MHAHADATHAPGCAGEFGFQGVGEDLTFARRCEGIESAEPVEGGLHGAVGLELVGR